MQGLNGEVEWQTFLEPEVDEGYAGVAVWGSQAPIDLLRNQAGSLTLYPPESPVPKQKPLLMTSCSPCTNMYHFEYLPCKYVSCI